jgi:hypothetical protein
MKEMNFVLLMFCYLENCNVAEDYIEITFLKINQKFFLNDIGQENKWISKKIEFEISQEADKNIQVNNDERKSVSVKVKIITCH